MATASAIRFDKPMTARVMLKTGRVLKGSTGAILEIAMGNGPAPAANWDEVDLVFDRNASLLLPGDRALLFLEYEDSLKSYLV